MRKFLLLFLLSSVLCPSSRAGVPNQLQLTLNDGAGVPRSKPVVVEAGKVLGFDGSLQPVMTTGGGGGGGGVLFGTGVPSSGLGSDGFSYVRLDAPFGLYFKTAGAWSLQITYVETTDTRLSNARTPTAHAATHAAAGSDPVTLTEAQITNLATDLAAKVAANGAITGATKTKVTYDAKGLVTAGADATTADISDSTNRRYVTDAQQTVIGNTSGTNTGDQTITLTGDVTGSGTGSFAATIGSGKVTLTQMANMATASLVYRKTAGSGAPEINTLATLKSDLGLTGTNSGDQTITLTGGVTGSGTGSFAATVVTNANLTGDVTSAGNATTLANVPTGTPHAGSSLLTDIAAPGSPAAGKVSTYADSTDLRFHDKNASGVIGTTVVADTGSANNFITAISAAGAISKTQPAFSNLSGSVAASQMPALTGDVTTSAGAVATTIASNAVTNAKSAQMATLTLKGNNTGGTANALDLTVAQVNTMLGAFTNPMTTTGDVIVGGSSGAPARLALGGNGTFLGVSGGVIGYFTPAGGGSGYATAQEEGSSLTQRPTMNFIGTGVTAADNSGSSRTDVTIYATLVLDFSFSAGPTGATGGSGSWSYTLPAGARYISIESLIAGGGGGGAGGRFASGTNGRGGGAGGTGVRAYGFTKIQVSDLQSSTLSITVGAGGAGGPGQTTNTTAGANGSDGALSSVVCGTLTLAKVQQGFAGTGGGNATGGTGGNGGAAASANSLCVGGTLTPGVVGAAGGTTGAGSNGSNVSAASTTGAAISAAGAPAVSGGGGAIPTTPSVQTGGTGGGILYDGNGSVNLIASSAHGAAATALFVWASGAGGGSSNSAGAGEAGGAGALGGGGGGGGASLNGSLSGAGGKGGDGFCRIIVYF